MTNQQPPPPPGDAAVWRAFWEHARWMVDHLWAYSVHIQTKANWLLAGSVVALAFAGRWVADASLAGWRIRLLAILATAGWLSAVFCCVMVLRLGVLSMPYSEAAYIYKDYVLYEMNTGESPPPRLFYLDLADGLLTRDPSNRGLGFRLHLEIKMRARWFNLAIWFTMAGLALSVLTVVVYFNIRP